MAEEVRDAHTPYHVAHTANAWMLLSGTSLDLTRGSRNMYIIRRYIHRPVFCHNNPIATDRSDTIKDDNEMKKDLLEVCILVGAPTRRTIGCNQYGYPKRHDTRFDKNTVLFRIVHCICKVTNG